MPTFYTKCWSSEPDQRPMSEVISTELEKLSKEKINKFIMNAMETETSTSMMESELIVNTVNDDKQSKPEASTYSMEFSSNDHSKSLESDLCIIKEIIKQSKPETLTHSMDFSFNDNRK
ncbi:23472_t:CDS:2, partial [Gigaspora margarita]